MPQRRLKPGDFPSDGFRTRDFYVSDKERYIARLDDLFFNALSEMARRENMTVSELASLANRKRNPDVGFARALRAMILNYYREAATEDGHRRAGHRASKK